MSPAVLGADVLLTADLGILNELNAQQWFHERDMTDGLPIIVPSRDRLDVFLAVAGIDPDEEIGAVDPARGIAVVAGIAVNALMAGCRPEHLPVVIASVEAMLQPAFQLHGVQATTNPVASLTIVNGPIRHCLGIDSGRNALSPGSARERADRTRGALRDAQHRRSDRRCRPVDVGKCREVHVLSRRGRGSEPLGTIECFARTSAGY